jgi:hypothetical protein
MEISEQNIECSGKKFGKIEIKETAEKVVLTVTIEPDSNLEVRATSFGENPSGKNEAEFTFKEKQK